METYITHSPEETQELGKKIGVGLSKGDVICVFGDLGAGKTCLIQGIARGLGVNEREYVRSPTFTILLTYQGRLTLRHFDFYRLSEASEIEELGLSEYFLGDGVCAIEWPERLGSLLPERRIEIVLEEISEVERKVSVVVHSAAFGCN
jgi:tRNA threonylcarbamoyladenosine biosynthesis protein TsaE